MRAKYDVSQADKPDARGRKLTYIDPKTKVQRAFFIPRNEKGAFGSGEEILAVINEEDDIATENQLENILEKSLCKALESRKVWRGNYSDATDAHVMHPRSWFH